ncbi:Amidase [Penicillium atrosanguineum]|nr:Amidase [Penicillium atrosanguineum]
MAESWEVLVQIKQADAAAKIPTSWRLPTEYTSISETTGRNVLDVPRRCGLLTPNQLEITENYDATSLLEKISHRELSAYEVTEAFCIRAAIAQQVTRCLTETFFDLALRRAKELDRHLQETGHLVGPLHGLPISFKDCFNIEGVHTTIGFTSFIKNDPVKSNSALVEIILALGGIPYVKTNIPQTMMTSSGRRGMAGIKACAGPLATSVRDLELFMSLVSDADPWKVDSSVIFSPWRTVTSKSALRLGLIEEDPHFPLHPPVLRNLERATEKLQAAGHKIIPLDTPSIKDACALAFRMFAMDPAGTAFQHIAASGEPTIPALASTSLPHEYMQYEYAPLTLEGLYDLNEQRIKFKEQFRSLIVQADVDAIIMPGYQGTAQPHDLFGFVPYTILWNLLDYPASIVPFGKANKTADAAFVRNVQYRPPYTPDEVESVPCCVQLVGRNLREEELMKVSRVVADVLAAR